MMLQSIKAEPLGALRYMERYVNDGSPSGFTELYKTSITTDPFGLTPWFHLYALRCSAETVSDFGAIPEWVNTSEGTPCLWIHPDMKDQLNAHRSKADADLDLDERWRFIPTSSARTVQFTTGGTADYVKLHYDALLGRVNRSLPFAKAIAGPELSGEISQAINGGALYPKLALLPEIGARVVHYTGDPFSGWGMVWRSSTPIKSQSTSIRYLIPFFALFSVDRFASYQPPLLIQLIRERGVDAVSFVLDEIVSHVIACYFSLLTSLGLQVEWNAQNLLLGLDEDLRVTHVVMRDLGEVEKDLTLRQALGLPTDFRSDPYKCISKDGDRERYQIRHSFAFDFKLGEYIIEPLLRATAEHFGGGIEELRRSVRPIVRSRLADLPEDFFPDNEWYYHDRILLTGHRPYRVAPDPKYR